MFFPSSQMRQRFYDLVLEMTRDQEGMVTNLDDNLESEHIKVSKEIKYFLDQERKVSAIGNTCFSEIFPLKKKKTIKISPFS